MKPTIIVIGSADVIKLGLIRDVGELGYKVISIQIVGANSFKMKPLDYYSKYVTAYYFVKRDELIALLINKCKEKSNKPIIFPLDDSSVYLVDKSHHILRDFFLYAHVNHQEGGIVHLMNKNLQKKLACEAGLNVAQGWEILHDGLDYIIPNDIKYPCFVKGELEYGGSKQIQRACVNEKELRNLINEHKKKSSDPLLAEEYLTIDKEIGYIGVSGEKYCSIPVKCNKIETGKGSSNGVTMVGQLLFTEECDQTKQAINRFLSNIGYSGIYNFDFIESKGNLYFLEINYRYAAYGYGVSRAGLNLPAIFINNILGKDSEPIVFPHNYCKTFFNEKVGIINVLEKSITYSKYKKLMKDADYLIIENSSDSKPYRMLWTVIVNRNIARVIRKMKSIVSK